MHQRGFAGTGRTHDRGHFTTGEIDAEMVERPDLGVVGTVGLDQIDRARHYDVAI